jgi:hypothetical protein
MARAHPACNWRFLMAAVLDWRHPDHWDARARQCRYCPDPTHLRDHTGRPAHKVCAEQQLAAAVQAATVTEGPQ